MTSPLRTAILAPIWLLQLVTGAKSFLDNPLIGSRRLNALGLHVARVRLADSMTRWRRRRLAHRVRPEWREAFDRDGFVAIADIIPPHEFPALREAVLGYSGPAREMRQGDAITRRMAVDAAMFDAIPALRELLDRADIKALFHYVASYRITPLHYIQTIVSKGRVRQCGVELGVASGLHFQAALGVICSGCASSIIGVARAAMPSICM